MLSGATSDYAEPIILNNINLNRLILFLSTMHWTVKAITQWKLTIARYTLLSDVFNQVTIQGVGDNPATARVMPLLAAHSSCKVKFPDDRFEVQGLFGQLI